MASRSHHLVFTDRQVRMHTKIKKNKKKRVTILYTGTNGFQLGFNCLSILSIIWVSERVW